MMKRFLIVVLLSLLPFVLFSETQEAVYHEVISGDTFDGIARKFGISTDDLKKWNPNVIPERIQVGQKIIAGWDGGPLEKKDVESFTSIQRIEKKGVSTASEGERFPKNTKTSINKKDKKKEEKTSGSPEPKKKHFAWVTLLVGLLLGAIFGILLIYFLFVKKLKFEHKRNEKELFQRIAELCDEKTKLSSEVARLRSKIQSIEKEKQQFLDENVVLGEEIDRLKSISHEKNDNKVEKTQTVLDQMSNSPNVLYADAIIEDCFVKTRETPNEDSIFVLNLKGENTADFCIYDSAFQRVVANPSFLEGCEKQILGNAMRLEIVSKGLAQKDASNGKWKVIDKLKVIIR